jgi:hypothetical protein
MSGTEFEYWDSCVFLAHLQSEIHRPGEMEYISAQAEKFDIGAVGLVTSSLTITEVFEARLTPDQALAFRRMCARSNFHFIDATAEICRVSSEIRSFYKDNYRNAAGVSLWPSTPDAVHVASAIAAQAGLKQPGFKLLTFDSRNKAKGNDIGLTNMSGRIANRYQLTICRPPVGKNQQMELQAA